MKRVRDSPVQYFVLLAASRAHLSALISFMAKCQSGALLRSDFELQLFSILKGILAELSCLAVQLPLIARHWAWGRTCYFLRVARLNRAMALQSKEFVYQGSRYLLPPEAVFSRESAKLVLKVSSGLFSFSLPLEAVSGTSSAPLAAAHQLGDGASQQAPAAGESIASSRALLKFPRLASPLPCHKARAALVKRIETCFIQRAKSKLPSLVVSVAHVCSVWCGRR